MFKHADNESNEPTTHTLKHFLKGGCMWTVDEDVFYISSFQLSYLFFELYPREIRPHL